MDVGWAGLAWAGLAWPGLAQGRYNILDTGWSSNEAAVAGERDKYHLITTLGCLGGKNSQRTKE
jgi:hypothetical protein